jgi:hypothetical protein
MKEFLVSRFLTCQLCQTRGAHPFRLRVNIGAVVGQSITLGAGVGFIKQVKTIQHVDSISRFKMALRSNALSDPFLQAVEFGMQPLFNLLSVFISDKNIPPRSELWRVRTRPSGCK